MEENFKLLEDYDLYIQKIIDIINELSNEDLIKKYLNGHETNKIFNMDNALRIFREGIYNSKRISSAILAETQKWDVEQNFFFYKCYQK